MDFLADKDVRSKLNITSPYLFASNTNGNPLWAYESLKRVCQNCGVERPQDITSTNLRKYMATLAQVMDLGPAELQQMCRHLGHTAKVHLTHYRTMSPYIERVNLGKILLMQDLNIQSNYVAKSLKDIAFIDIVKEKITAQDVEPSESHLEPSESPEPDPEKDNDLYEPDDESDKEDGHKKNVKRKPMKRQKWSGKEIEEIKKYFARNLEIKTAPRMADCIKAKRASFKSSGEIHKRDWHLIVKKVSAMNNYRKK